MSKVTSPVDRA